MASLIQNPLAKMKKKTNFFLICGVLAVVCLVQEAVKLNCYNVIVVTIIAIS